MTGPVLLVALISARSVGEIQALSIAEPFGYPSRLDTSYFESSLLNQSSIKFSLDRRDCLFFLHFAGILGSKEKQNLIRWS